MLISKECESQFNDDTGWKTTLCGIILCLFSAFLLLVNNAILKKMELDSIDAFLISALILTHYMTMFYFYKLGPNMIKGLYGHSMVNIGGDLIVIGGVSSDYSYSYSLFKMACNNLDFEWTEITETKLKIPRSHHVSMVVPRSICRGEMKPLRRQISKGMAQLVI